MKINEVTSPLSKINKFLDDKKRKEEYARKLQKQRDEKEVSPVEEAKDWTDKRNWPVGLMVKHPKPEITQWYKWDGQQWVTKSYGYPVSDMNPELEPFLDKAGAYEAERLKGMPNESVNEDFGSIPPLTELIIMAVIAKTSVDVLKGMFKTAVATGKGLKKLNALRKKAASIGQGVADYAIPEAIDKTEIARKIAMNKDNNFKSAALAALERLVNSKGDRQSIGGYAFDIARAFSGIDAKELIRMYNEKHGE